MIADQWICYSCGAGGTMEMLISLVGESDADPKLILRDVRAAGLPTKRLLADKQADLMLADKQQMDPLFVYAKFDGYTTPPDWALESRGIGHIMATRYSIKWDKGWVLPIWSPEPGKPQESLWGWQWKRMSVVLNWPDEVKKSGTLFGLRELGLPVGGQALTARVVSDVAIVESPLDVVRLAMCGVPAVAAFGVYVSKCSGLARGLAVGGAEITLSSDHLWHLARRNTEIDYL